MKYENIKVGDTVYLEHKVRTGWRNGKIFWLPVTVEKVTPKQFQVKNKKYRKDTGRIVGDAYYQDGSGYCKDIGDDEPYYPNGKDKVSDQTIEYRAHIGKLKAIKSINEMTEDICKNTDEDYSNLMEIHASIRKAHELMLIDLKNDKTGDL